MAELLIALAILGVIAAFSIPKILQVQQDARKKAVFRETIGALNDALYQATLTGQLRMNGDGCPGNAYNLGRALEAKLNYVKKCTDSAAEGCWIEGMASQSQQPGWLLANGSYFRSIDSCQNGGEETWLDWNGTAPPNVAGDDQIRLFVCDPSCSEVCNRRKGAVTIDCLSPAAEIALWNWIWSP